MANRTAVDVLVKIDHNRLDAEAAGSAKRTWDYGQLWADAKWALKKAQDRLEVLEAQLKVRAYRNPGQFGIDGKATGDNVEAVIHCHPDRVKAVEAVTEAQHDSDVFETAYWSMNRRANMIEKLLDLTLMNYRTDRRDYARGGNGSAANHH